MSETVHLTPGLEGAASREFSAFNREVEVLLLDVAHLPALSGERLDRFWTDLRSVIGDRASDYKLLMGSDDNVRFAMLVPKVPAV